MEMILVEEVMVGSSDHDDSGDDEEEAAAKGDEVFDYDREDESAEQCARLTQTSAVKYTAAKNLGSGKALHCAFVIKHLQLVTVLLAMSGSMLLKSNTTKL